MTLQDSTALLAPLAVVLQAELDAPTFRSYHRALQDVPVRLLEQAVERAKRSCRFFPKPAELRQFAEEARVALLEAHPFQPCANCSSQGWTEQEIDGVWRAVRCRCWSVHQARLQQLGVSREPVALTEAE